MRDMLRQRFMMVAGALLQKMSTSSWAWSPKPLSAIICLTTMTLESHTDNIACHLNAAACHSASRWSFQFMTGTSRTWSMNVAACFKVFGLRSTVSTDSLPGPSKVFSTGRLKLPSNVVRKLLSEFMKSLQNQISNCLIPSGWRATRAKPKALSDPRITVAATSLLALVGPKSGARTALGNRDLWSDFQ